MPACLPHPLRGLTREIDHCEADGVVLQDGSKLDVDLVIYCTGYSKTYDFLEPGGWVGGWVGGAGCGPGQVLHRLLKGIRFL